MIKEGGWGEIESGWGDLEGQREGREMDREGETHRAIERECVKGRENEGCTNTEWRAETN